MDEIGIDIPRLIRQFTHETGKSYVLVKVSSEDADAWASTLGIPVRRCYIDDSLLEHSAAQPNRTKSKVVASRLPDRGSTMAGDFGEILVLLYHAACEHPSLLIAPKKWRLKQDRTKPAPYSDVIHFSVPSWPRSSGDDAILCSEVKTKSTGGQSTPIPDAIIDCEKDRTSRLANTLVWLRDRAMTESLGNTTIELLDRFLKADVHPPAQKRFHAVAVVCESLVDKELAQAPDDPPNDSTLIVIAVPDLKRHYEAVFDAVHATVAEPGDRS